MDKEFDFPPADRITPTSLSEDSIKAAFELLAKAVEETTKNEEPASGNDIKTD
jgi:hypothetical protein